MKYSLLLVALLSTSSLFAQTIQNEEVFIEPQDLTIGCLTGECEKKEVAPVVTFAEKQKAQKVLTPQADIRISVTGQGVSPMNTASPAQAYALAKRAAVADAYRMIAERVKGVYVDGQDVIKNMMVQRSTVRTTVNAMVQNANVVETTFKEGLCEVEMEVVLSHSLFTY